MIIGGEGTTTRTDSDQDFAGSIGLRFKATEKLSFRVAYERYNIDHQDTDFPTASVTYRFGSDSD